MRIPPAFTHPVFRRISAEKGATLVYFAVALTVLMGFAALILDVGIGLLERRNMQNAADAAALAGARVLALGGGTSQVEAQVNALAAANGAPDVSWTYINGGRGVHVETDITFQTGFARILGIEDITTGAESEASIENIVGTGNLLPMVTQCEDFVYGGTYRFWDKDDKEAPGNFGWTDWNGGSCSNVELASNIANPPNSGVWHIGDWLPGCTGVNSSSAVRSAVDSWVGKDVTIPLYDAVSGNGNNAAFHLCGFAQFVLTDWDLNGKDKYVEGYFVRKLLTSGIPGSGPDYGLRNVRITR